MFIQSLWQQRLTWELEVPKHLLDEFDSSHKERHLLSSFSTPRPFPTGNLGSYELIGFCDSSLKACCAVIYIRSVSNSEVEGVRLVCAKTRVSPIKALTIPKLELCAAALLSKLIDRVHRVLRIDLSHIFTFSNSRRFIVACKTTRDRGEFVSPFALTKL